MAGDHPQPTPLTLHPTTARVPEGQESEPIGREALAAAQSALAEVRSMRHQLASIDSSVCRVEDEYKHAERRMRGHVAKVSELGRKLRDMQGEVDDTLRRVRAMLTQFEVR